MAGHGMDPRILTIIFSDENGSSTTHNLHIQLAARGLVRMQAIEEVVDLEVVFNADMLPRWVCEVSAQVILALRQIWFPVPFINITFHDIAETASEWVAHQKRSLWTHKE